MKYLMILILLVCLLLIRCNSITDSSENNLPTQKIIETDDIEYTLIIEKSIFSLKDTLKISFQVRNKSSLKKDFKFNNIQQLGFQLINMFGKTTMFYPSIISPALSSFSLLPGEIKILSVFWTFTDYNGKYIGTGLYDLIVYLADKNLPYVSLKIIVK